MTKIIFFEFAGRRVNMEMQRPYVEALLDANHGSEFHLWDLTRTREDQEYLIDWLSDRRVHLINHLHTGHPIACIGPNRRGHPRCYCMKCKPPYEEPWHWYAARVPTHLAVSHPIDQTVYVKFDDDVIWMDTDRFGEVLEFLEERPDQVASANVINNAVCAKYEPLLHARVRREFGIGGHEPEWDNDWWHLHTRADFAKISHEWMGFEMGAAGSPDLCVPDRPPVPTREGEKVSINFVAMKGQVLKKAAFLMRDNRMGDEGAVDLLLPWIIPNFRVAHLSFGPQEKHLTETDLAEIRNLYKKVGQ